jgi:protein required for attachment to host cells
MLWVVNYNAVQCHIYVYEKNIPKVTLVKELKDSKNRGHKDPKEVEVDHFTREIAALLEQGRNNHEYEELVIIGPPHLNGLLFKHVSKYVKEMVKLELQKYFQNISDRDLLEFLQKNMAIDAAKEKDKAIEKEKDKEERAKENENPDTEDKF